MKYLVLILTITFNSYASYIPLSKVGQDTTGLKLYTKAIKCQKEYSEKCIKLTREYDQETAILAPKMVDDLEKPIKECEGVDAILDYIGIDENGCKITGYEQKDSGEKIIVVDEAKKAQVDSEKLAKAQKEAAISAAMKARRCGERVMALVLVRNAGKNLSKKQVRDMNRDYSDIESLLSSGSLETARDDISAMIADGVVVTESDKTALIAELDACK